SSMAGLHRTVVGHHKAREVGTIDDSIRQEQPGQRLNRHPVGADVLLCYEVSPPQVAPTAARSSASPKRVAARSIGARWT
ncbi:hypothetical protein, partial [Klebsiella aerogenes]|uniref:hypothetical protein n=1 Tax=Klebsiella aerogenes TaxID=548 RepID=UPI001954092F